jgi:cellulose biosynthesis protein BcsQ
MPFDLLLAQLPAVSGSGTAPTWTDKEVMQAVGTAVAATLGAVVAIASVVIRFLTAGARERARLAESEARRLRKELEDNIDPAVLQETKSRLEVAAAERDAALESADQHKEQADGFRLAADGLARERDSLLEKCRQAEEELATEQRRITGAVGRDGLTWADKVLKTKLIDFKPLDPDVRTTPVISVLNLKGGVGKTTTTAHLGAALAKSLGYRVLLIDLDLQGSLTEFYTTSDELIDLDRNRRVLVDFLNKAFDAEFPKLSDYMHPILPGTKSALVPTTDNLAYAELKLTVRWFLRDSARDPRFLLRRELQLKRVTDAFDVVLLDCPPLLNTCCVNALAASDYVLVPVMPSKQSTDRVPILFERLKQFRENINPELRLMGFFANRTHGPALTTEELGRLARLRTECKDVLDKADAQFDAFIRQSATIRRAEDDERTLGPDDDMHEAFLRLAREVEDRLPTFCRKGRPASAVPAEGCT